MPDVREISERIKGKKVVVFGDLCLDENVIGRGAAVAKEAPVIALTADERVFTPGQAANVAVNARALGASVSVVGVVGADEAGTRLLSLLEDSGIDTDAVVVADDTPTIHKIKIVGREAQRLDQHLLHVYWHPAERVKDEVSLLLARLLEDKCAGAAGLILSDYCYGVVNAARVQDASAIGGSIGAKVVINTRGELPRGTPLDMVVANAEEVAAVAPDEFETLGLVDAITRAASAVGCSSIIVTVGRDGMYVWSPAEGAVVHLPALARTVIDVTGAGDTVTAAAGCALAAGFDPGACARFANVAAAVVVGKPGTAAAYSDEIYALEAEVL